MKPRVVVRILNCNCTFCRPAVLTVSTPSSLSMFEQLLFGSSISGSVAQQMAHRSRRRPAVQDVQHMANASNGGRDRSPVAVHAPHWDNNQPLTNWYRDQLMAKIEELHHPRRAQLRRARVPTLVHVPNFWGVAGSEDFACATLPTTPLDLQGKLKIFVTLPS